MHGKPLRDERNPDLFVRSALPRMSSTLCLSMVPSGTITPWIKPTDWPPHAPEFHSAVSYVPTSSRLSTLQMVRHSWPSEALKSRNN
jgi:hypothetical protein